MVRLNSISIDLRQRYEREAANQYAINQRLRITMDRYEQIKQLIAANEDVVNFAEFGNGVSQEWIDKAEAALGFPLPPSYKWWLRNYGGGDIGGDEITCIYEHGFDTPMGQDVVSRYRRCEDEGCLPLCDSDIDADFWFDLTADVPDHEYPVVSRALDGVYATDFLDFLKKRIEIMHET